MNRHIKSKSLSQALPDESRESARAIRRVVRFGCAVNAFLMILKIVAGKLGHSDALVADGFHSLNDLAADIIMLLFVGISYRAADSRYSYGYGKFETFSSFIISAFLVAVSCMIGFEALESIAGYVRGEELPQPDIWTFVVVLLAMTCKEGLYRFYSRAGRRAGSNALIANAWHHRSDALASVATLVGVTFSHFFGPAFRILDPVASLVIAVFIFVPALRLLRPAFAELMERSLPVGDIEKAREAVSAIAGVGKITWMRTRRIGHHLVFDIGVAVSPDMTVAECGGLKADVTKALKEAFCSHVIVTVCPEPAE
ncbi:MAG: cation diffusion facilitator family transporter [Muribaculaceae bacterium]|nr:cation diffusion facilitator family transporter [Muribaculaceae bacterium]